MKRSTSIGHMPLPPYIKRDDRAADRERYQTVFARERGSVAAPTAGLHFTPALNALLAARGIDIVEITLHVGYGTFQPVRVDRVEEHRMEAEEYTISEPAAEAINRARDEGRRIIAVGTTTTRTLEAAAAAGGGRVAAGTAVDGPVHLPRVRLSPRRRPADELPPAAIVAADAGLGVCRASSGCWRRMPRRSRAATGSTATATRCWSPDAVVRSPFPPAGVAQLVRARVS